MLATIYELAVYQRRRSTPLLLDMRPCSCTLRHAYLHSFEAAQCKCHSWSQHGLLFRRCCNLFIGILLRVCNHVAYLYSVQGAPHATNLPHDLPGPFRSLRNPRGVQNHDFVVCSYASELLKYCPHRYHKRTCKRARDTKNIVPVPWRGADTVRTAGHTTTGASAASQIARASGARHACTLRPIMRSSSRASRRYAQRRQRLPNRKSRRPAWQRHIDRSSQRQHGNEELPCSISMCEAVQGGI
jgi:hypothetical protein